jgi:hypothetical protein
VELDLEHAPAAHRVAALGTARGVQAPAEPVLLLEDVDVTAGESGLPDQQRGCRQGGDPTAHQVRLRHHGTDLSHPYHRPDNLAGLRPRRIPDDT